MSNKRRRQTKKKHEVPLTEDMLNELNKASFGHQGSGYGYHQGYAGYDNYGQDPDEFYDMEDVWSNDNKYYGQQKYKVKRALIFWPTLEFWPWFSATDFSFLASVQYYRTRNYSHPRERSRQSRKIQSVSIRIVWFMADGMGRLLWPIPIGSVRSFQFSWGCES